MPEIYFNFPPTEIETSPLPEECQELYSGLEDSLEMNDEQLRILLNGIPKKITEGIVEALKTTNPAGSDSLSSSPVASSRENWLKRNSYWTSPCIALVGLVLGTGFLYRFITVTFDERIELKIKEPTKQIADQGTTLAEMKGRLGEIADLLKIEIEDRLHRVASLSHAEFDNKLPEVKVAMSIAKSESIPLLPDTATAIRVKLIGADRKAPGFWGAAGAFISYNSPRPTTHKTFPNCLDHSPVMSISDAQPGVNPGTTTITHGPLRYFDCRIELDSPIAAEAYANTLTIASLEFINCLIVYKGRPIVIPSLAPPQNRLVGTIRFVGCVFDFAIIDIPSQFGKTLITNLLSSPSLQSVSFTLAKDS